MVVLLDIALAAAMLLHVWFVALVLMPAPFPGWEDGPSRGAMVLVMLEPAVLTWLVLLGTMAAASATAAFDWLAIGRRWLRALAVTGGGLLLLVLAAPCVLVAIGASAAVSDNATRHLGWLPIAGATAVAILVPALAILWLSWRLNAPLSWHGRAVIDGAALAGLALTALTGGILGGGMMVDEIRTERRIAARDQEMIDEREAQSSAEFAKLTDASPLHSWGAYATDELDIKERRETALRRLATRPSLEADLAKDLVSTYPRDSDIAFLLVARVQFAPSAALEAPLRETMSRIAAEMRKVGFGEAWPGDADTLDSYIRTGFGERLTASLAIARRMADTAGVDLRSNLDDLQAAALAGYPKTKSALTYKRDVATAEKDIAAALAKRSATN